MKKQVLCLLYSAVVVFSQEAVPLIEQIPVGAIRRLGDTSLNYPSGISDMAATDKGELIVANRKFLDFWRLSDCSPLGRIDFTSIRDARISSFDLPDGNGPGLILHADGYVSEFDLKTRKVTRTIQVGKGASVAVYSPDKKRILVTNTAGKNFEEYELNSGKSLGKYPCLMHSPHDAIYGKDGKHFFSHGSNGSGPIVAAYELGKTKPVSEWNKEYYSHGRSLRLSEDGKRILNGDRLNAIEWIIDDKNIYDPKKIAVFGGHHGHAATNVSYVPLHPEWIMTGSRDGSVRLWDRTTKSLLVRWWPHARHVARLIASRDGKYGVSFGGGTVAIHKLPDGVPVREFHRHTQSVESLRLASNNRIISAGADSRLIVWDYTTGSCKANFLVPGLGIYALAVSSDCTRIAVGCKDGRIREISLLEDKLTILRDFFAFRGYVRAIEYMNDGRLVAAGDDGTVKIWSRDAAEPISILEGHRGGVLCIDIAPDGNTLASGGRDGTIRLWNLADGKEIKCLRGSRSCVQSLKYTKDGKFLWSAAGECFVRRWNLSTGGNEAVSIPDVPYSLSLKADGYPIAGLKNGCYLSIDAGKPAELVPVRAHVGCINAIVMLPDKRGFITAAADNGILVWK